MNAKSQQKLLEEIINAIQHFLEDLAKAHPWLKPYEESLVRFIFETVFALKGQVVYAAEVA